MFRSLCMCTVGYVPGCRGDESKCYWLESLYGADWRGFCATPNLKSHIGLKRDLYIIFFVYGDNLDLSIGRRRCSRLFNFFLLDFKWRPQVSLLLKVIPRYLTSLEFGISDPWKYSGEHSVFLSVKFTRTEFSGIILIRHLVAQFSIKLRWFYKNEEDCSMSLPGEIIAVSFAYEAMVVFFEFGISAVYILNRSGERSLPWDTPAWIR